MLIMLTHQDRDISQQSSHTEHLCRKRPTPAALVSGFPTAHRPNDTPYTTINSSANYSNLR